MGDLIPTPHAASEGIAWWQMVGVPFGTIGATLVTRWLYARNSAAMGRTTAAEKKEASLLAERDALSRDTREAFERIEADRDRAWAETARERERRIIAEIDRDRGWDLARWWFRTARDLDHALRNAQVVAMALARRVRPPVELPPPQTFDVPVNVELPIPRGTGD